MINFPCICSHSKADHAQSTDDRVSGRMMCFFMGLGTSIDECPCLDFIPDNLRMLENLSEQSQV